MHTSWGGKKSRLAKYSISLEGNKSVIQPRNKQDSKYSQNHCRSWLQSWNSKMLASWKNSYDQLRQNIKKQRHYLVDKGPSSQSFVFSSSHVCIWELDHKEIWGLKNWCFWTVMLEKTLEGPLGCKKVQPVHPKGDQSWIFTERTDTEAEAPILLPDVKNWLIGKDPDAGKDRRQKEKGTREDEVVGWHHWLYGHEFEQAPGDSEGRGSLACCSPWGCKESDVTEQLNWTEKYRTKNQFQMATGIWFHSERRFMAKVFKREFMAWDSILEKSLILIWRWID